MKCFKKAITFLLVVFLVLIILFPQLIFTISNWIQYQHRVQECMEMNIYNVEKDRYEPGNRTKYVTYMICRPETTQDGLKAQIDNFLMENDLVESMTKNHHGTIDELHIRFIRPSDFMRVGETGYDYGEPMPFSGERRLCCVTFLAPDFDEPQYEFFPENFEDNNSVSNMGNQKNLLLSLPHIGPPVEGIL